jgi:hypothetical protein
MTADVPGIKRDELVSAYAKMALDNGFMPQGFITLTYDRKRFEGLPPTREMVITDVRRLVHRLNKDAADGGRYRRMWGHSYFGYILGIEHHKDGVFHAHMLVDNWVNYQTIHDYWNALRGFAWVRPVGREPIQSLEYVLKYVAKSDGAPVMFFQHERRTVEPLTGRIFRSGTRPKGEAVKGAGALPLRAQRPLTASPGG